MKHTEQEIAKILIQQRQQNGRPPSMTNKQKIKYLPILLILFIAIGLPNIGPNHCVSWLIFGVIIGALAREWKWRRIAKSFWPFNEKIIDWKIVEAIANPSTDTVNPNS